MYLLNKIAHIDKKAMNRAVDLVAGKSGKKKIAIFLDMIYCGLRYQAGYNDYVEFEFYKMRGSQRKTYLTQGKNNKIIRTYNSPEFKHILDDKIEFNKKFNKYLNRAWLNIKDVSFEEFKDFMLYYKRIVGKVVDGEGGVGVDIYSLDDYSVGEIYRTLASKQEYLVEQYIEQHTDMSTLYKGSVNTLRIFTFCKDGKSYYLNGILKIGNGGAVDNFSSGGMYAFVNSEGTVETPAIDKADNEFEKHPITNADIVGFEVPLFKEAVDLVKKAHLQLPEVGYIGWDVAIGVEKPMIVEGNFYPGIFQRKASYTSGQGLLTGYKKYMKL